MKEIKKDLQKSCKPFISREEGAVIRKDRKEMLQKQDEKQFVTSEDLIEEGVQQGRIQGIAFAIAMMYKGEQEKDI